MHRACRRTNDSADESAEHDADENYHDGGDHARDVADERRHHVGERLETERVRREQDHREHHQPEHEVGEHARGIDMRSRALDRLRDTAPLEQMIQTNSAKTALGEFLQHLREQVSSEQNDQRAEERRQRLAEHLSEARLQSIAEVRRVLLLHDRECRRSGRWLLVAGCWVAGC